MKPEVMPGALGAMARGRKGPDLGDGSQEVEGRSRDACDFLWEESLWGRTKEASLSSSKASASRAVYPYPRRTEEGDDGTEANRRCVRCLSNRPEPSRLESAAKD